MAHMAIYPLQNIQTRCPKTILPQFCSCTATIMIIQLLNPFRISHPITARKRSAVYAVSELHCLFSQWNPAKKWIFSQWNPNENHEIQPEKLLSQCRRVRPGTSRTSPGPPHGTLAPPLLRRRLRLPRIPLRAQRADHGHRVQRPRAVPGSADGCGTQLGQVAEHGIIPIHGEKCHF